jgi:hypothetical protein
MKHFGPDYRTAIEASLRAFVNNGDSVACIGCYVYEYGDCHMCPKKGIKWHYVLENLRTHHWLIVGSECIENYGVILSEWGYRPVFIDFPEFLRPYTAWILKDNPDVVVFNDTVVKRFQVDCGAVIRANSTPEKLGSY